MYMFAGRAVHRGADGPLRSSLGAPGRGSVDVCGLDVGVRSASIYQQPALHAGPKTITLLAASMEGHHTNHSLGKTLHLHQWS